MDYTALWNIAENKYKVQQKKWEWVSLLQLVESEQCKNIVEIGCYDGGSTWSLSNFAVNLITVDMFNPARFDVKEIEKNCAYTYFGRSSHDHTLVEEIEKIIPQVDLLFIDGDHSYEGSLLDYKMYSRLVKSNGLIGFHDIVNSHDHRIQGCGVYKTWQDVKAESKKDTWEFICDASGNIYNSEDSEKALWGGIGVIRV